MPRSVLQGIFLLLAATVAQPACAGPSGPASQEIEQYIRSVRVPCYTKSGEGRCTIASIADTSGIKVFYGRPSDGREFAVAFVDYQYDATGNAMDLMALVLRLEGGRWVPVGRADNIQGGSPRDVRFAPGRITYVGTVVGPNDVRAAPKGRRAFTLLVDDGSVRFVRGAQGEAMSNRIQTGR